MNESVVKYQPLTKKVNINGQNTVVCSLFGTEKCQIHNSNVCIDAKYFQAILEQLNAFEEIYMDVKEN